ncbi:MAG: phosphate starvation-inducible protein PsiF [Hyphomicrobiales bacterium]|nr:phosphate starvation-inducible protein PsiF [Hyphomicrobiales bacterium]MDE2115778.1 phosphate starvation-inducible protein PsiF [Hyphomicrobiales bacterium]
MAKKKVDPAAPAAAAAPAAPAAAMPAAPAGAKPKSAISIKCSQEADAQKLHGAARKKFREACKKGK